MKHLWRAHIIYKKLLCGFSLFAPKQNLLHIFQVTQIWQKVVQSFPIVSNGKMLSKVNEISCHCNWKLEHPLLNRLQKDQLSSFFSVSKQNPEKRAFSLSRTV